MNSSEQFCTKKLFELRVLKYNGQQFEDFFVEIMSKSNPDFQPVKAYGNIGDKKNDGFDKNRGVYYQVFAPEDISNKSTIYAAVNKLEADFEGLYNNWNGMYPIKEFYFVINDKYKGIAPPIIEKICEIEKNPKYADIKIDVFKAIDLEREFDKLDDVQKSDIIGSIFFERETPMIQYEALNEVVVYLLTEDLSNACVDNLIVPDPDEKIAFNGLSDKIKRLLDIGSYQNGALSKYFDSNPGIRNILQERFQGLYQKSKTDIPETIEKASDCRFEYICEAASPRRSAHIRMSVFALMAYYFYSCDIFEEPKN